MKFRAAMYPFPCIIIILVVSTFNVVQGISAEILEEVFQFNLQDKAKKSLYSVTARTNYLCKFKKLTFTKKLNFDY